MCEQKYFCDHDRLPECPECNRPMSNDGHGETVVFDDYYPKCKDCKTSRIRTRLNEEFK